MELEAGHKRTAAFAFLAKAKAYQIKRAWRDLKGGPRKHGAGDGLVGALVVAEHHSFLWHVDDAAEMALTAGKVQNLRVACCALNGLEVGADEVFSFWKQVGRTTGRKGYLPGRELREGCLIPNIGGGLCQLSNALYGVALQAGFLIVERHAHSRVVAGSLAEEGRDATVFWNYVDLRFRSERAFRLECRLSKDQLVVRVRAVATGTTPFNKPLSGIGKKASDNLGNCLTCGHPTRFRNRPTVAGSTRFGQRAFLLDAAWPEHDAWCKTHWEEDSLCLVALDGARRGKANYRWTLPKVRERGLGITWRRSLALRTQPKQGAALQNCLLKYDRFMAERLAGALGPQVDHCIVSQNLLPHLWAGGHLGGRTFDVLMTRWPLRRLQELLDEAARWNPGGKTLVDFRAPEDLLRAEEEALQAAESLVTPHRAMAGMLQEKFGNVEKVDWARPERPKRNGNGEVEKFFFPASALARKGVYELATALRGREGELLVLGGACEEAGDGLKGIEKVRRGGIEELESCQQVVLPAYVENQPRILLEALARGIPVIATKACGLDEQEGLTLLDKPIDLVMHWQT